MSDESDTARPAFWPPDSGPRLPRIALMGEFSAGKSTLANLMIGTNPLPVQVVATQLPPVLIQHGTSPTVMVDLEGNETPCTMDAFQDIDPDTTAYIRFHCVEEILTRCDLIDMPGISDPNMSSAVWERVLPLADAVIWCTPATQAWRQSEASVWQGIDAAIRENSMLVITRADMMLTEWDRAKVLNRVRSEAGDQFAQLLMMSLSQARDGAQDAALWAESGADAFVAQFLAMVDRLAGGLSVAQAVPEAAENQTTIATSEEANIDIPQIVPRRPALRRQHPPEEPKTPEEARPDPASYMPKFS